LTSIGVVGSSGFGGLRENATAAGAPRKVVHVAQFPSLKAKKLMRVLQAQPLGYEIVRQKGSHRKL
jgi:hypothetical protein